MDKAKVFVPGSSPQMAGAVPTVGSARLHGGRVKQVCLHGVEVTSEAVSLSILLSRGLT